MHNELQFIEMIGWVAAALTLSAFAMRSMLPLRMLAVSSNIAFITYGGIAGFYPVLVLHCILLPFNIYRIIEILRVTRAINGISRKTELLSLLAQTMTPAHLAAGTMLFRRGDQAGKLYLLVKGRISLIEIETETGEGEFLGEIGFFLPDHNRTLSAQCITDCEVLEMTERQLKLLYFQNPQIAFALTQLIASRVAENIDRYTNLDYHEVNSAVNEAPGSKAVR